MPHEERDLLVPRSVDEANNAREILRLWTTDEGERVVLRIDDLEPGAWGLLLVDVARHAANAYARRGDLSANEALSQLVTMFIAEMEDPTDTPEAVDD